MEKKQETPKKVSQKKGTPKKNKNKVKSSKLMENKLSLPKIEENFGEWFNEVLFQADIIDYRYNLKGCGVWLGYGFKLRKFILQIIRNLLDSTPIPHEEMLFPLLIPEPQFMKEAETVKGFEEEVYWVTDGGTTPLDVKLALRPTSETAMYPMAAKWIRSHQDLPLKTYQIVNSFRYEGKNTRPLIRVREITTFKEAHTYHKTPETCEIQIKEALECYSQFFNSIGIPYVITQRPKWDTFPGADYTIAYDCMFPQKHRALQIGTIHNLSDTFAKTFNIKYENVEGEQKYVYQTCYGMSERVIAAAIASHGDDKGLIIPPMIAPIQIVIVPILFKGKEKPVLDACEQLLKEIKNANLRVNFDNRDMSSGKKYFYWELRGVPLRIEIGPRDVENNKVCIVRRDTKEKNFILKDDAITTINETLESIQQNLHEIANNKHKQWILRTNDLEEGLDFVEQNKGIAEIPFCGDEECAAEVEKRIDGLKFLGIPFEYLTLLNNPPREESDIYCAHCMKKVSQYWRIGRPY